MNRAQHGITDQVATLAAVFGWEFTKHCAYISYEIFATMITLCSAMVPDDSTDIVGYVLLRRVLRFAAIVGANNNIVWLFGLRGLRICALGSPALYVAKVTCMGTL